MDKVNQDYIGWWLGIIAVVVMLFPVTSCIEEQEAERTKKVQVMSKHCAEQGKTFKAEETESSEGLCI